MDVKQIKLIRICAGMNQYQFSEHIGESRSQLALVEAGYRKPSRKMVAAIKDSFEPEYIELIEQVASYH